MLCLVESMTLQERSHKSFPCKHLLIIGLFLCVFPLYNLFKYLIWWFISVHEGKTKWFRYLRWLQLYNMLTGPFNDIKAHYTSPFLILQLQICQKAHDWNWSFQQRYKRTTTREGFCHRGLRSDCPLNVFCVPQFLYLCYWF